MFFNKKECIAMILAGGQGSRLNVLTSTTAKPAVPFGGKYRLIDFPLSNCVNSGIGTVGILTQYQPLQLNEYIGNGQPWGLNSNRGGIHVLSPYSKSESSEWYKGTANSIFQNISFIDRYNPTHVLILSGDHIYKMDYSKMLSFHKRQNADCTIAVLNVTRKEASRFGIMNTDENNKIIDFQEKPKHPKSTKASMGIYIFKWDILRKYLIKDNKNKDSHNDFGKDIIPQLIKDNHNLYAYDFVGYWKDVGTIDSLWESNMDILGENPKLDLNEKNNRIYSRNYADLPTYIAKDSNIKGSFIAEGNTVYGEVKDSIISTGCTIKKGAKIINSFIMPNTVIKENVIIDHSIVGENSIVNKDAKIGGSPKDFSSDEWGISVVGKDKEVPESFIVLPKEIY